MKSVFNRNKCKVWHGSKIKCTLECQRVIDLVTIFK